MKTMKNATVAMHVYGFSISIGTQHSDIEWGPKRGDPKGGDPKGEAQRGGTQRTGYPLIFIDGYPSMIFIDGYPSMNINGYAVL